MKFENTEVFNFEGALRGMRLPMKSSAKADSKYCLPNDCYGCPYSKIDTSNSEKWIPGTCYGENVFWLPYQIGKNDMNLAQKLAGAGSPHNKFLRQIFVSVDITAPLYWWKEMDQYKVGTVTDSESTMHKLASTPITLDCFETDDFDTNAEEIASNIIKDMERLRQQYLETKDKRYWKELVRWLPEGWLQTRTWTANYAILHSIYFQRKDHKLTEWHQFCDWAKTLPYANELITYKEETK